VSVALLLIPQAMAYAVLAGLPVQQGIYAATLPLVVAAVAASSPYLQTGPVALTSLLTLGALSGLADPFTPRYIALAALLALIVGGARLLVGLLRAGGLAYLMSQPIVVGFIVGGALLIVCSQVPTVVGVDSTADNPVVAAADALTQPGGWEPASILLALAAIAIVFAGRRLHPLFPGVLLSVILGIGFSRLFDYGGATVGKVPTRFPRISFDLPWGSAPKLIVPGLVIALLGFAESAAVARRFAAMERQRWDPNREFVGQGLANIASGAVGGYPTGGSLSRTGINKLAGAETRWSGAIAGIVVFALIPLLGVISALPTSVLGALVIVGVAPLIEFRTLREYLGIARLQFVVAALTFAATLALAPHVERAVLLGLGLAIAAHLWRELRINIPAEVEGDVLHLRPRGVLYFASAPSLEDAVTRLLGAHPNARRLIVHLGGLGRIDLTGALVLKQLVADAGEAGLDVEIRDVPLQSIKIVARVIADDATVRPARSAKRPDDTSDPDP
jgi:SulP family sulfate permease